MELHQKGARGMGKRSWKKLVTMNSTSFVLSGFCCMSAPGSLVSKLLRSNVAPAQSKIATDRIVCSSESDFLLNCLSSPTSFLL